MPCSFDDDVLAVCSRGPRLWHPAKHWWAGPLSVLIFVAGLLACVVASRPQPVPVHKPSGVHQEVGR